MVEGCGALEGVPLYDMAWYVEETFFYYTKEYPKARLPCGTRRCFRVGRNPETPAIKLCNICATLKGYKW